MTNSAKFWANVDVRGDNECWEWKGRLKVNGYGAATYFGRNLTASRVAWSLRAGISPPKHLLVCHTCDNRKCCNPAHLYLGTPADNNRDTLFAGRFRFADKTHCKHGHEFTAENTRVRTYRNGSKHRICKECELMANKSAYERQCELIARVRAETLREVRGVVEGLNVALGPDLKVQFLWRTDVLAVLDALAHPEGT